MVAPAEPTLQAEAVARELAAEFRKTAAERDLRAGTPVVERESIRASGLLKLLIPSVYGGPGGTWPTLMACVRELARADGSLAHLLGYHHLGLVTPHLIDGRLNGKKSFCTGTKDSDLLLTSAIRPAQPGLVVAVVPTQRQGITVEDDWDNMGQRQTDSGSVTFSDVVVEPEELLGPPGPGGSTFASLRTCVTQTILGTIFVGAAEGALEAAAAFTTRQDKPFPGMASRPADDQYVQHHVGEMWATVSGAARLVEDAADALQTAWEAEDDLTPEGRGQCAVVVATAKVAAAQAALDVTSRVFDVVGARATSSSYRFDRLWRNVRTLSLHDPIDYKAREVGDWALNGRLPTPSFYS